MTDETQKEQLVNKPTESNEELTLEKFAKTLNWLRFENGYNYTDSQRYFQRVHNIDKDHFESLSRKLDDSQDPCLE
jgi:hypothetical protein